VQTVKAGSTALVAALMLVCWRPAAAQSKRATGIAECDRYVSMMTACLQKMCEDERMLVELELEFSREALSKVVELRGRDAAAQSCAQDIRRAVEDDPYGCHGARAGDAVPFRLDHVRPGATSVAMQFSLASATSADVFIGESLGDPARQYRVAGTQGRFVLDTTSDKPVVSSAGAEPPAALEPGTTYCFAIRSAAGEVNSTLLRKGTFTTRKKVSP
jgi:hypothetical protein